LDSELASMQIIYNGTILIEVYIYENIF